MDLEPVTLVRRFGADNFYEPAKPSNYIAAHGDRPRWMTFDDQWVEESCLLILTKLDLVFNLTGREHLFDDAYWGCVLVAKELSMSSLRYSNRFRGLK